MLDRIRTLISGEPRPNRALTVPTIRIATPSLTPEDYALAIMDTLGKKCLDRTSPYANLVAQIGNTPPYNGKTAQSFCTEFYSVILS